MQSDNGACEHLTARELVIPLIIESANASSDSILQRDPNSLYPGLQNKAEGDNFGTFGNFTRPAHPFYGELRIPWCIELQKQSGKRSQR